MSAGFTPGPWERDRHGQLKSPDGRMVVVWDAGIAFGQRDRETEANASLIAAAPELYEALEEACEAIRELRLSDGHAARTGEEVRFDRALSQICQHENRIKLLLAKARGEA